MENKAELKDRNILITNNASHFVGSLACRLCEMGANVLIADANIKELQKLANAFNEQREVYPFFGRVHLVELDLESENARKECFQSASEAFGGLDCWIDYQQFFNCTNDWKDLKLEDLQSFFNKKLLNNFDLYQKAIPYLQNKRNSCILRLMPEDAKKRSEYFLYNFAQTGFQSFINTLDKHNDSGIRFFNIELGPTEDHLLSMYQGANINEALANYKKQFAQAKLVNSDELAECLAFVIGNHRSYPRINHLELGLS
ncbi:MAG: SDR family NAD(P)-dependent oxidoreductase [Bdellovibrionota bacterium]